MNARLAMAQSRAQGYETERFVRLFAAAQSEVLRYILALVPDLDDAQEVFQETAVDLWKTFDQYDPDCPFVPWACRFAYFQILRILPYRWHHLVAQNNQGRMELHVNGLPTPAVAVGSDTVTEACRLLLGRLKPEPRLPGRVHSRPLVGRIDELALYDRPLSADEVRRHYELGTARSRMSAPRTLRPRPLLRLIAQRSEAAALDRVHPHTRGF
jgi:DNA-directed RNA polymerase specialized sigma24 family protein